MLYEHGPREQDREQDKGVRQGVRRKQDSFAASHSHCPHMVVGTLNSSMVVGTLKFSIKCYMGAWVKSARQGARQGVRQGATQGARQGARQGGRQVHSFLLPLP